MYTTKKSKNDTDFEIKLLTQYTDFISQIELKEEKEHDEVNMSFESEFSDASDDDQETGAQMMKYEHVPLTQNDKGLIYFVTSFDGHCTVKQINPKDDGSELVVFEIKSDHCNGFSCIGKQFYFLDAHNVLTKLE